MSGKRLDVFRYLGPFPDIDVSTKAILTIRTSNYTNPGYFTLAAIDLKL